MDDTPHTTSFAKYAALACGGIGLIFSIGIVAGLLAAHAEKGGGPMSAKLVGVLIAAIALAGAMVAIVVRNFPRTPPGEPPLTKREAANRNIWAICMILGGVLGAAMAMGSPQDPFAMFGSAPISPVLAASIAAVWVIAMPILIWRWNRVIDEQEADAYRQGAYWGFMVYGTGAPLWWVLRRGGLVPEPNGVIIYYVVMAVCGFVWIRKKYA